MAHEQFVSWSEIDSLVNTLTDIITKSSRSFLTITTLSRGGMIPSRLLADRLDIEEVLMDKKTVSSDSLVVDDIYDSGKTFEGVLARTDNPTELYFATLFARCGRSYPAQLVYARQTDSDAYVVFPWDKLEFERASR